MIKLAIIECSGESRDFTTLALLELGSRWIYVLRGGGKLAGDDTFTRDEEEGLGVKSGSRTFEIRILNRARNER